MELAASQPGVSSHKAGLTGGWWVTAFQTTAATPADHSRVENTIQSPYCGLLQVWRLLLTEFLVKKSSDDEDDGPNPISPI